MIYKHSDYSQAKWLNGLGETLQLTIHPKGSDFKAQQFDYRISIATLTTAPSPFSIFQGYNRWLMILEGGPVTLSNKTKGEEHHLEPLKSIVAFDGSQHFQSKAETAGKDFNLIVSKKFKGSMEVLRVQGSLTMDLSQGIHYFYNYGNALSIVEQNGSKWMIEEGQLLQVGQKGKIVVVGDEGLMIHCCIQL